MQLTVRRVGDIRRQTEGIIKAGKQAHTTEFRRTGSLILNAQRRIISRRLSPRAANTLHLRSFPATGYAANPKVQVFSSWIMKRVGGLVDVLTVFREGAVIAARSGGFLAVGARASAAVAGLIKGIRKVKTVTIPPRLKEIDGEFERLAQRLPGAIEATYKRLAR